MTTLTMKEEKRLEIIQRVFRGELTVVEAGMVIGVSERQCYRINARVKELRTPLPSAPAVLPKHHSRQASQAKASVAGVVLLAASMSTPEFSSTNPVSMEISR